MRRVLRQDPDVIFIGEMRDSETVGAALSAAETGHLVLSTLHTTNATETVNRVVDFFPSTQQRQARLMLAGVLKGVISQRLVPRADGAGRAVAIEAMLVTGRIADRIIDPDSPGDSIEEQMSDGDYHGMQTFDQSLFGLVKNGEVSLNTAIAAAEIHMISASHSKLPESLLRNDKLGYPAESSTKFEIGSCGDLHHAKFSERHVSSRSSVSMTIVG